MNARRTAVQVPVAAGTGMAAAAGYWNVLRPWLRHWGTTARTLTIYAPVSQVWPWLVQMGYRRGGLYSDDWLDRLFSVLDRPSAERILPEFQHLAPGDVIPVGKGPGWPVHQVVPERALVLTPEAPGTRVSWAFVLEPVGERATRLISRVRGDWDPSLATDVSVRVLLEPEAFVMERRMLLGIKERAERLADERQRVAGPAVTRAAA